MRLRLGDDTLLVSASHRRYITFRLIEDCGVVLSRTDSIETARANHRKAIGRGFHTNEVVTIDANGGEPRVLFNRWYGGTDL